MGPHRSIILFSLVALVLCPVTASANAGTPLMWAAMLHLVIGNLFIGLGEGFVLARLFKLPVLKTAGVMVAANYLSAWVGYRALASLAPNVLPWILGGQPLYQAALVLWGVGLSSYLASVVLELPFCWFCLRVEDRTWRKALVGSLAAQTASYALLVPYYLSASPTSLVTSTQHDASLRFASGQRAWVYFIAPERGDIFRIRPDGSDRQFVLAAGVTNQFHRLLLLPTHDEAAWNLTLVMERGDATEGNLRKVLVERIARRTRKAQVPDFIEDSRFSFGEPVDYRTEAEKKWDIRLGYWAAGGVRATKLTTQEHRHFALEAPFLMDWYARNATVLPDGLIIYQLGQQIVALDVERKLVGFITLGGGPVVVLEE